VRAAASRRRPAAFTLTALPLAALVPCLVTGLGTELLGGCQRESLADCDHVADRLADIEVGPAGTPAQHAASRAHHQAACTTARVTTDEAACLDRARDTWAATRCVPRMFDRAAGTAVAPAQALQAPPPPPGVTPPPAAHAAAPVAPSAADVKACAAVVERVRQAVAHQIAEAGSGAQHLMDRMLPAMQRSCELDHWPPALRACIVATKPGDMEGMVRCTQGMSPHLQQELQKRMLEVAPREP